MKLEVVLAGSLMLSPGGGDAKSSALVEQTAERQVLPSVDNQPTCELLDKHTGEKLRVPDCKAGKLVKRVYPVYPPLARQARISGTVTLHVLINKKGRIEQLEVISGHPLLVQASVDAVKKWEYEPSLCGTGKSRNQKHKLPSGMWTFQRNLPPCSPNSLATARMGSFSARPVANHYHPETFFETAFTRRCSN